MATTGMKWLDALPLALLATRQTVCRATGHTPFELLTGRTMPSPQTSMLPQDPNVPTAPVLYKPYWDQSHTLASSLSAQEHEEAVPAPAEPLDVPGKVLLKLD